MRYGKGILVGIVAASLAGCSGSASWLSPAGSSAGSASRPSSVGSSVGSASRPSPVGSSVYEAPTSGASATIPSSAARFSTKPAATAEAGSVEPETQAGARAAAVRFYRLYSASQFAASWDLLIPSVKRQIPRSVWVEVHTGCPSVGAGKIRIIKAVTVFGNAAIITEEIAGAQSALGTAEDVFNYANGHWRYAPGELGIYHHSSVAADVAAAKAVGFCASKKPSLL